MEVSERDTILKSLERGAFCLLIDTDRSHTWQPLYE
jgi:hypothetical protein